MNSYRNPWHKPGKSDYGPEFYTTETAPVEYRGFQIFHRHAELWELVKDGVCLTQRAGKNGPRKLADALLGDESDDQPWLIERASEIAKRFNVAITDKPLAAPGLTSYRYKQAFGYIMIGARDIPDALSEANRSLTASEARVDFLQVWNGNKYINVV